MTTPLISIIIPVYNVEKYLHRCVDSLINQTYKNLEIILVDDGSLDGSPQICDEYMTQDKRIKVIHQPNMGLSGARNTGLRAAQGSYIGFVDSDDWVDIDMYEYLLKLISENKADAAQVDCLLTSSTNVQKSSPKEKTTIYQDKDILQYYLTAHQYSVCRCLFKKQICDNILFRVGKINEDIDYKYKVLANAKRFIVSNQYKYYYYQDLTSGSISRGGLTRRNFDLIDTADEIVRLTERETYGTIKYEGYLIRARVPFSLLCKMAYFGILDSSLDKAIVKKYLREELRKNVNLLLHSRLPLNRKILVIMFAINYDLTETIIRFVRKIIKY